MTDKIKQSNPLTWAKFSFTALELNLLVVIVQKLQYDQEVTFVQLTMKDVSLVSGKSNQNSQRVRASIQSLQKKLISWNDGKTWVSSQLIGSVSYQPGTGRIKVELTPTMLVMLRDYSRYTVFYLRSVFKLSSTYEKRIYQMARNYVHSRSWRISVVGLREMLQVPDGYNWAMFWRRVILKSCQAITKHTELNVSCEPIKDGKRYADLQFTIEVKDIEHPLSDLERRQIEKLRKWGFGDAQILSIRKQIHCRDLAKLLHQAQMHGNNPGAYLNGILTKTGFKYTDQHSMDL